MKTFSSKHLIIFFGLSLCLAFGSSLFISNRLGRVLSNDLRDREISLLFGAIEAGPLAIARLNSSAFSQQALERLMASPSLSGRAIQSASITGGPLKSYNFARWDSHLAAPAKCISRVQKTFQYPESLNSFEVTLSYDKCNLLAEEQEIYKISLFGITLVFVLVSIALLIAALPILQSLRATFLHLKKPGTSPDLGNIKFLPLRNVAELALKSVRLEREAVLAHLSKQVAHDIRSPLSALKMAIGELDSIPSDYRLMIRNSIQRINDIANNLLKANANVNTSKDSFQKITNEPELLYLALDSLVSEKRMQYRDYPHLKIEIDFRADQRHFVKMNISEFHRAISNLINNSVEAMNGDGVISISVDEFNERLILCISDNGKGMPPHVLEKLGERGFSHGKTNSHSGSGLGIFHAKETIEAASGSFNVESSENSGTKITLVLPIAKNPDWFVGELIISKDQKILVLDDDENIFQMWKNLLGPETLSYSNAAEFSKKILSLDGENILCLIDYELHREDQNGLDLIETMGLAKNSLLVTSRYDELEIRERAKYLGVKIIPKSLIEWIVPKTTFTKTSSELFDYVLIDDETVLRLLWEKRARKKNIKLLTLKSSSEFSQRVNQISKETTHIYIDSELGLGEMRGEDFAKVLHDEGYQKLFIASGYDAGNFAHLPWLNFTGKDCPF